MASIRLKKIIPGDPCLCANCQLPRHRGVFSCNQLSPAALLGLLVHASVCVCVCVCVFVCVCMCTRVQIAICPTLGLIFVSLGSGVCVYVFSVKQKMQY